MDDARFRDQLLPLLDEQRVIPVVGQNLLAVELDGRAAGLYEHLAGRLALRLGVEGEAPRGLDELACRHLAQGGALEDIYPALKREMGQLNGVEPPAALLDLAGIEAFRLYVSTTFDDLLWRAVDRVRCNGERLAHSLAYALNNDFKDLPDELGNLQRPVVYQLFGRVSAIQDSYAVTDEDLLEFVHNLQIEDRRPRRLFEALASNHLLVLGGGFPPWLVRFFLRAVKHRDRLWQVRGRAGFVVDRTARADGAFVEFLHHYSDRTLVYSGESAEFIAELGRRWRALHLRAGTPAEPAPSTEECMPRYAVFLSYASEDRTVVERIKEQLEEAGIDTWFDRDDLKPASGWKESIRANIDRAAVFVPVISASVLRGGAREFRVEWEAALEARKRRSRESDGSPARFILPVAVDGTDMQANEVRPYFGDTQALQLPGGIDSGALVAALRELVRAARLAAEGAR